MINVLFAVDQTTWLQLKQNFQYDEDGNRLRTDLTDAQAKKLRATVSGHWKTPELAGTTYHIVSWYVPEVYVVRGDKTSGLTWVEFLENKYPNKFILIGAWDRSGAQFGTTVVPAVYDYTDPENIIEITPETIAGTPIYPIHAQYMKVFPDDVTYDIDGNETSRTAAVAPKEVNKIGGWADRRWL